MSHSSGVRVSDELKTKFSDAVHNGGPRILKVIIQNEQTLVMVQSVNGSGSWEKDFDLTKDLLDPKVPSYLLFRTDEKNSQGKYQFYILRHVPDASPVRLKMLSSSTISTLKTEMGSNHFIDDIFGTTFDDFSTKGFQDYLKHKNAAVPLTSMEEQTAEELERGVFTGGAGTSSAYAHGVAFPVNDDALAAIDSLSRDEVNYVQIGIDANTERVILLDKGTITIDDCKTKVPLNEPRFHLFNWKHEHEGENFTSLIFCYSCVLSGAKGTISAPVKQRMLYSTSKANVMGVVESRGLSIAARIEVNSADEFSAAEVLPILHPAKAEGKKTFAKAKPPGQRKLIT